jgi:hypothetical protein
MSPTSEILPFPYSSHPDSPFNVSPHCHYCFILPLSSWYTPAVGSMKSSPGFSIVLLLPAIPSAGPFSFDPWLLPVQEQGGILPEDWSWSPRAFLYGWWLPYRVITGLSLSFSRLAVKQWINCSDWNLGTPRGEPSKEWDRKLRHQLVRMSGRFEE